MVLSQTIVLFNPSVTFNHSSITPFQWSTNNLHSIKHPFNSPSFTPLVLLSIMRLFGHPSVVQGSFPWSLHLHIAWKPIGCSRTHAHVTFRKCVRGAWCSAWPARRGASHGRGTGQNSAIGRFPCEGGGWGFSFHLWPCERRDRGFVETSLRMMWQFPQVTLCTRPHRLQTNGRGTRLVGGGKES